MKKNFVLVLIVLLFPMADKGRCSQPKNQDSDIQILYSSPERLVIRYLPIYTGAVMIKEREQMRWHFQIENAFIAADSTQPIRKLLLALTSLDLPNLSIIDSDYRVLRIPAETDTAFLSWPELEEKYLLAAPIGQAEKGMFLSSLARLNSPGVLGEQAICEVQLAPVRYFSTQQLYFYCRQLTVQIDFSKPDGLLKRSAGHPFATILEKTVTNNYASNEKPVSSSLKRTARQSGKKWYRLPIAQQGLYSLSFEQLRQAGLQPEEMNARQLHVYYGGGRELNPFLQVSVPELREIAIYLIDKNSNGLLEDGDALIFYAQGVSGWEYARDGWRHYINHYNSGNVYWLGCGSGAVKSMAHAEIASPLGTTVPAIDHFRCHVFEERDKTLPDNSGLSWMWDVLLNTDSRKYPIDLVDAMTSDSVYLSVRMQGLSETDHTIEFYINEYKLMNAYLPYTLGSILESRFPGSRLHQDNFIIIRASGIKSSVGIDWYEMTYTRSLRAVKNKLVFNSDDRQGLVAFRLSEFTLRPRIFEISDPFSVTECVAANWDSLSGICTLIDSVAGPEHQYLAVADSGITPVTAIEPVEYDLGAHLKSIDNEADYLIITHESLSGEALNRFQLHRSDPLYWAHGGSPQVKTVTTREIYDQFAQGLVDPVAIRNFLRYARESWHKAPSYVLLIGDATFDFKDNLGLGKSLLVPSYENGLSVSDDWLVNLTLDRYPDMMIGRLPVHSQEELAVVVDKIIQYDRRWFSGAWRSRIALVADDSYRNNSYFSEDMIFLKDTEYLANLSDALVFDVKKMYLADYPWDRVFNKPLAKQALMEMWNEGFLYINYFGHANWNMLAHENLLRLPNDLPSLQNGAMLPMFFGGTCEIARIDDPRFESLAELLVLTPEKGVVACVGSSRWNMHLASAGVSKAFFKYLFDRTTRGAVTLGQALLMAKTKAGFPDQTEIMFLLGDPALRLAAPDYQLDLSVSPDSLSNDKRVFVRGQATDFSGQLKNLTGQAQLCLYASSQPIHYGDISYLKSGKQIYNGLASIDQGVFNSNFFIQADTVVGGNFGRFTVAAWPDKQKSGVSADWLASGTLNSLIVRSGERFAGAIRDTLPPDVQIFLNGRSLGGHESEISTTLPIIFSGEIADTQSGVANLLQADFGLKFTIDDSLISDFSAGGGVSFTDAERRHAHFSYEIKELALGEHQFNLLAYDAVLNPFAWQGAVLLKAGDLVMNQVMNYPNPFAGHTFFTFTLNQDAVLSIKIFTISGRCIRIIQGMAKPGFNCFPEEGWDGTDEDGDSIANGVYLYKVIARASEPATVAAFANKSVEVIGKLIIAR